MKFLRNTLSLLILPVFIQADTPQDSFSTKPILRLETGMHTAKIYRMGMDAKQKYLVTASEDKTIRVWDTSLPPSQSPPGAGGEGRSLKLVQTIRPPIGDGNEGKLYAVAISPDGETIVAGGWTGDWEGQENNYSIYFYQRKTGKLTQRIDGLDNVVRHLQFSPDGKQLSASLKNGGIRVFQKDNQNWKIEFSDIDYNAASYGSEFSLDGGILATTCFDGKIRLYNATARNGKERKPDFVLSTKNGKEPISLTFSPSRKEIAVGYYDSTAVDIYELQNEKGNLSLLYLYSPITEGIDNGNLGSVAYSGEALYAGGMYIRNTTVVIRKWEKLGKGKFTDFTDSPSTIIHILPFSQGILYGTADPDIGAYLHSGKMLFVKDSQIADFRGAHPFQISEKGNRIGFTYNIYDEESYAHFSLSSRNLQMEKPQDTKLPKIESEKFRITDWKNSDFPKFNENAISLDLHEGTRSLAIHPQDSGFLLGTEWRLRYYNSQGKELWKNPVPGVAWAVNISGDGRLAAAALGDGTIRWYRTEDGKELLTFFPHKDKKRWVLFTPDGYYDASIGGEELIGWHVNRGKDKESDFFPVSKFRETYYRPDIVSKVLELGDVEKAIAQANAEAQKTETIFISKSISGSFPSVVTVVSPSTNTSVNSTELDVELEIRSPAMQKVNSVKIYMDGKFHSTQSLQFQPKNAEEVFKHKFTLGISEKAKTELGFVSMSESEKGTMLSSAEAHLRVLQKSKSGKKISRNLFLVSIGVAEYQDSAIKSLTYSSKDAEEFYSMMKSQEGVSFDKVELIGQKVLLDKMASRSNILETISEIQNKASVDDITMVFLSGHGFSDKGNKFYFLPYDYNSQKRTSTGVPGSQLMEELSSIKGKVILFVDACYSGTLTAGALNLTRLLNEAKDPDKRILVFSSSTKYETSLESASWKNGAFTKALKEAILEGKAANSKKEITPISLQQYLTTRVKELSQNAQTPVAEGIGGEEFIIVEIK